MEKIQFAKDDVRLQLAVTNSLIQLGIPAHLSGFDYLRTAIILTMCDKNILRKITKELYPAVSEVYSTTPSRVERAIRHAIEVGFSRGDLDLIENYFGNITDSSKEKATNGEFIATVADRLSMNIKIENLS